MKKLKLKKPKLKKRDGMPNRLQEGLLALALSSLIVLYLVIFADVRWWPILAFPPACMILAMVLGHWVNRVVGHIIANVDIDV